MTLSPLHQAIAADLRRQRALADVLDRLHASSVRVLVIKGAALAYTLYEAPTERPRHDADLLIPRGQIDDADAVLRALGYRRAVEPELTMASAQRHYLPPSPSADAIDLHWRVANPQVFDRVLPFEPAWSRSIAMPALGAHAWTLAPSDALLLACVHRVAHHANAEERPWLEDIDRLVRRLDRMEVRSFVDEALRSDTSAVCVRSLELAARHFGTPSAKIIETLRARDGRPERSAVFVDGAPSLAAILASDLRHVSWRGRARLLKDHLFPSAAYMRSRYPRWPALLLPLAYAARILTGLPAWFRTPDGKDV